MFESESLIEAGFQFGKAFLAAEGRSARNQRDLAFFFRSGDKLFKRLSL
jgi:hypothetical protein